MNPAIFISGGGDISDTYEVDHAYFSSLKGNARILYVPLALDVKSFGFEKLHEWFTTLIATHESTAKFDILNEDQNIPDLGEYDSVYFGGGNTYKLLDFVLKTDLAKKIKVSLKKDLIIYGGSAGAIILGKDIRTVSEENDKHYKSYEGLNLVGGQSILCHYLRSGLARLNSLAEITNSSILALPENAGISFSKEGEIIHKYGEITIILKPQ